MKVRTSHRSRNLILELDKNSALPPISLPDLRVKHILVPVDFSACSQKAFHYAIHFARQFNSELMLLHVVVPISSPPEFVVLEGEKINAQQCEIAGKELSKWRQEAAALSIKAVTRSGGTIYSEIIDAARESNSDLIVIGNHGRTGLSRMFIGGTAERVVRHAPCPVLVIREREHDFVPEEVSHVAKSESHPTLVHHE